MLLNNILLFLILAGGMFLSYKSRKLTFEASLSGGFIAALIFAGASFTGIAMLTAFFIFGTWATSWKRKLKRSAGFEEAGSGRRKTSQVFANGSVAAFMGFLSWLIPTESNVLVLMLAGSLSSAIADTISSEMGNIYGSKFYNILTLKKDRRGSDGVVSLEGTLFGLLGSMIIAVIYIVGFGWGHSFLVIILAGFIGNITDSILGAALERRNFIKNDTVNLLNTLAGALSAFTLDIFLSA